MGATQEADEGQMVPISVGDERAGYPVCLGGQLMGVLSAKSGEKNSHIQVTEVKARSAHRLSTGER